MAHAGQSLQNPVTGEHITFLKTSAETGGEYSEIELRLAADGAVPGTHVHPYQEERFEVVAGTMKFRLGFKKIVAGPGEVVVVPAGAVHNFANAGDDTAQVIVRMTPALKMEELFETTVALAKEGRVMKSGMPKPLDLAVFTERFADEARAPFPPYAVVRVLFAPLRWMARRRGRAERSESGLRPVIQGA